VAEPLSDETLLAKLQNIDVNFQGVRQYYTDTPNPIAVATIKKERRIPELFEELATLHNHCKILIIVDEGNDLDNPYMLVWRVTNNIDAKRDVVTEPFIMVDATNKDPELGEIEREWPPDVVCDAKVLEDLRKRGVLDIDEEFIRKYGLV